MTDDKELHEWGLSQMMTTQAIFVEDVTMDDIRRAAAESVRRIIADVGLFATDDEIRQSHNRFNNQKVNWKHEGF